MHWGRVPWTGGAGSGGVSEGLCVYISVLVWVCTWIGVTVHGTTSQHVLGYLGVFKEKTKSFHGCGK